MSSRSAEAEKGGLTPNVYISREGSHVAERTTDKWWKDRWQCELLAVCGIHSLSVQEGCQMLTAAYFGVKPNAIFHSLLAVSCFCLKCGTFTAAMLTEWSWALQLFSLSFLVYFVNRTACLRSWAFEPNSALADVLPELLYDWSTQDDKVIVWIATQSSSVCHLRALFSFNREDLERAMEVVKTMKGRYHSFRKDIKTNEEPYKPSESNKGGQKLHWLSYEAQSSFYGLVGSVVPENITFRTISVLSALINGVVLLVLGFGATVEPGWNRIVLVVYLVGIICAITGRSRGARWTMPEFEVVDLTCMVAPHKLVFVIELDT